MSEGAALFWNALAVAVMATGVRLLRQAWRRSGGRDWLRVAGGWGLIVLSFAVMSRPASLEVASAYGLMLLSVIAYAIIFATREVRTRFDRASASLAPEPEQRRTNWTRATMKSLLAIVLAGVAAIGVGVAFAVAMPLATHDRVVIGGVLVPLLWGGGMAWTLADAKLLRATLILLAISAVSYGIAFLPKVLGS